MLDFSFVCCITLNKSFNLESRYLMYKVGTRATSLESCKCFCCVHSLTFWFVHNSVLELLEVKACVLSISNFECPTNGRHSINELWSLSNICHNNNSDFLFKGNASFFFSFLTFWETSALFYKVPASIYNFICSTQFSSVQSLSLVRLFATPMNCSTPGLPVHYQLPEFTQTHVHRGSDAIQPSHPLSSPSPPAPNPSQHQSLFQWINSSHEVAKVLEFQLQYHSLQRTPRADLL